MSTPLQPIATDDDLVEYMVEELGSMGVTLGLSTSTSKLWRAVVAVLSTLGVEDVEDVTDQTALLAIAAREAWRVATAEASSRFDLSEDGTSMSRSQLYGQAKERYADAIATATPHDPGHMVSSVRVGF